MVKRDFDFTSAHRVLREAPADERFDQLIRRVGLDPATDLRLADWSGVDFSGCDLREFDFSGARLVGCRFDGARIEGARFDKAELGVAGREDEFSDLKTAKDWDTYASSWRRSKATTSDRYLPRHAIFQDAPFAPQMVIVPSGKILLGETKEDGETFPNFASLSDPKEIEIPSFAVGRFAVTWEEWQRFLRDGGRDEFADQDGARGRWKFGQNSSEETRGKWTDEDIESWDKKELRDMPAVRMTWHDAKSYVAWLSARTGSLYRLLEAYEWEYVARAGTSTAYWFGDAASTKLANYNPEYCDFSSLSEEQQAQMLSRLDDCKPVQVQAFLPNPWGLYQVHGNVWEWCEGYPIREEDTRDEDIPWYSVDPAMMVAPTRGGCYTMGVEQCRSAAYKVQYGLDSMGVVGLRVARELN